MKERLHAHEPLGEKRCLGTGVCQVAGGTDSATQDRSVQFGLDFDQIGYISAPADCVARKIEPLYQFTAAEVIKSYVVATYETTMTILSPGQAHPAGMWVYVGGPASGPAP